MKQQTKKATSTFNTLRRTIEKGTEIDNKGNFNYKNFINSELEIIIEETPMKEESKEIARLKFIKCLTDEEIADKMQLDIRTIQKRKKRINEALIRTSRNLFVK